MVTTALRIFVCILLLCLGPLLWWQQNGWPVRRVIPTGQIFENGGHSYKAFVPLYPLTERVTDGEGRGQASDLRLLEGPLELGPAHVPGDDVAASGQGRFSDWTGNLVISASDNGDPRNNGRLYSATYRAYPTIDVFLALFALDAAVSVVGAGVLRFLDRRARPDWSAAQRRRLGLTMSVCGVGAAALFLFLVGLPVHAALTPGGTTADGGVAYRAPVPERFGHMFAASSEDEPGGSRSDLRIMEDGRSLGPARVPHVLIRSNGNGAYSHWDGGVVFSASDNSDPRDNGRSYVVAYQVFLKPVVFWSTLAMCVAALLVAFRGQVRVAAGSFGTAWTAARGAVARSARPNGTSMLLFGGYTIVYALALLLLYGSLVARHSDTGGFKINFEYKAF